MPDLTAADIHAIYSPLWERVPETCVLVDGEASLRRGAIWYDGANFDHAMHDGHELPDSMFAALCFKAAWDWFNKNTRADWVQQTTTNKEITIEACDWLNDDQCAQPIASGSGLTEHHAIVAAILATLT